MAARTLRRRCNCSTHAPCTLLHAYPFSIFRSSLLILRACSHSIWHERDTPQSLRDEGRPISGMQERGAAVHPGQRAARDATTASEGHACGGSSGSWEMPAASRWCASTSWGAPFQPGVREVRFGESLPARRDRATAVLLACDVYGRRGRESRRGLDVCTMMPPWSTGFSPVAREY